MVTNKGIAHWDSFIQCNSCGAYAGMPCKHKYNPEENKSKQCKGRERTVLAGSAMVDFNNQWIRARLIPDDRIKRMLGIGHYNPHGRKVIPGEYRFTPDTCEFAAEDGARVNRWIRNGTILICTGCGLDGT